MRNTRCAIGVMAKAPQAGRSKTRLCPPLHPEQAAAMSAAFLRDITENLVRAGRAAPIDGLIAYAPRGYEALFDGILARGTGLLLADGTGEMPRTVQGFGRCLLHAMRSMLGAGYAAACVLNSDSPTLPTDYLVRAAQTLLARGPEVVVLGPAEDGGYYLLGAADAHAHLFADIAWSTDTVAETTRRRVGELGLDLVELPVWYDVDDRHALGRLCEEAGHDGTHYPAPASAAALAAMRVHAPLLAMAAE
jgi:rSAM/selenodomain-associated transferase 1